MGPDALGWYLGSVKISQWGLGLEWPFSKLVLNVRARGFWLEICASIKMQFSGVGMRAWIWKFHQIRGHRVRKLCLYNKIRLHNQNKNKTPFKKGIEKECWTERKETCSLEKLAEISSLVVDSRISNLTHMAGFQCNLQNHLSFYHLCTAGRLTPTVWRRPLHIPWCGLWWEYNTSNCCLLATRVVCSCSGALGLSRAVSQPFPFEQRSYQLKCSWSANSRCQMPSFHLKPTLCWMNACNLRIRGGPVSTRNKKKAARFCRWTGLKPFLNYIRNIEKILDLFPFVLIF